VATAKRMDLAGLPLTCIDGQLEPSALTEANGFKAVITNADPGNLSRYRLALAERTGELLPLVTEYLDIERYQIERHLCIDTTAAGGNASLIAAAE